MFPPAVSDFKAFFVREFAYGLTNDLVTDADVTRALSEAGMDFNSGLWLNTVEMSTAYLYVAAHFLALNIQNAGGLSASNLSRGVNSAGGGVIESKAVGSVSVGYAIPDFVRQNPMLSQFMQTGFGQKYLALIWPRLVGNVLFVPGGSGCEPLASGGGGGKNINQLTIATTSLMNGTVGHSFSQQLNATGGLVPLVWTVNSGTLPSGLSLSTTGLLAGTPTVGGAAYFSVQVVDGQATVAQQNYQLVVM